MERRAVVRVANVWISARVDQQARDLDVPPFSREVESELPMSFCLIHASRSE